MAPSSVFFHHDRRRTLTSHELDTTLASAASLSTATVQRARSGTAHVLTSPSWRRTGTSTSTSNGTNRSRSAAANCSRTLRHDHRHVLGSLVERRPRVVGQERAAVRHGDAAPAPLVPHAEPVVAVVGAHGRVEPQRERGRGGGVAETEDGQRLDRVRWRLQPEDQAREDADEGGGERDCGPGSKLLCWSGT
jgi:hypothetical protein